MIIFFLWLIITKSAIGVRIRWSISIFKSQKIVCILLSYTDSDLCINYLAVFWNFHLLHNSLWITVLTQWFRVFYSFCARFLHSPYFMINCFIPVSTCYSVADYLSYNWSLALFCWKRDQRILWNVQNFGIVLSRAYIMSSKKKTLFFRSRPVRETPWHQAVARNKSPISSTSWIYSSLLLAITEFRWRAVIERKSLLLELTM